MNSASLRHFSVVGTGVFLAWPAAAHPGHGLGQLGTLHLVTSPFHVVTLLGLGTVLWLASRLATHQPARRRLATLGTMSVGAAGVFWGLGA